MARTLVLVEGDSDAAAVRAAAGLLGVDLEARHIDIVAASGITNFPRALRKFLDANAGAAVTGLYDIADER